jgi:hypothetical protein
MPPIPLSVKIKAQKKALRSSSEEAVSDGLGFIKRFHLPDGPWIGSTNRYTKDCIATLKRDLVAPPSINSRHLGKYIAASTVLHAADGWDILGKAIDSHVSRSADVARHLGYYAELRAAMSLLASEGIGIFSNRHFSLDKDFLCNRIPSIDSRKDGTHQITWLVIQHWSNLKRSSALLGKIIRVGGRSLQEWLDAFNYGQVWWELHGSEWLKDWGVDLKHLADDRDARNTSSYRPTRLKNKAVLDQETTSNFLINFWKGMEPTPMAFEKLDRHLLRITLERGFEAVNGTSPLGNATFQAQVVARLAELGFAGPLADELRRFIIREIEPTDHVLISEAKLDDNIDEPRHHIQVLSRAVLLLRLATGAADMHLRKAGVTSTDLKFWWEKLGEDKGEWDTASPPLALTDLWADIEDAIEEVGVWEGANAAPRSFYQWREECRSALSTLTTSEKILFWGLAL